MPIYCFKDRSSGDVIERFFHHWEVPQSVTVDDRTYQRSFSNEFKTVQGPVKDHITRVPAKWTPGFKHTKEGWCVVESKRQMNNYAKEKGLEWS